jgi:hypothetical protein
VYPRINQTIVSASLWAVAYRRVGFVPKVWRQPESLERIDSTVVCRTKGWDFHSMLKELFNGRNQVGHWQTSKKVFRFVTACSSLLSFPA